MAECLDFERAIAIIERELGCLVDEVLDFCSVSLSASRHAAYRHNANEQALRFARAIRGL
jgi:hypothetical protein